MRNDWVLEVVSDYEEGGQASPVTWGSFGNLLGIEALKGNQWGKKCNWVQVVDLGEGKVRGKDGEEQAHQNGEKDE